MSIGAFELGLIFAGVFGLALWAAERRYSTWRPKISLALVAAMIAVLHNAPRLRSLAFGSSSGGNRIGDDGVEALVRALREQQFARQHGVLSINLKENSLSLDGEELLAAALSWEANASIAVSAEPLHAGIILGNRAGGYEITFDGGIAAADGATVAGAAAVLFGPCSDSGARTSANATSYASARTVPFGGAPSLASA